MQHILGLVRRCVEDYHMIDPGETVAVGVSGGKDSLLTLAALAQLRRFYPVPFNVHAITLETGTPGMSFDAVADLCRDRCTKSSLRSGRRKTLAPCAPSSAEGA